MPVPVHGTINRIGCVNSTISYQVGWTNREQIAERMDMTPDKVREILKVLKKLFLWNSNQGRRSKPYPGEFHRR